MSEPQKEDKSVPWEEFEMGTAEQEDSKRRKDFPVLAKGLYEVVLTEARMERKYNKFSGQEENQIRWKFDVICNVVNPQGGVLDQNGQIMENALLFVWSTPKQIGTYKDAPQLTRLITTSLLGIDPLDALPGGKFTEALVNSLIGLRCHAFIKTKDIFEEKGGKKVKVGERQFCNEFMKLPKPATQQSTNDTATVPSSSPSPEQQPANA